MQSFREGINANRACIYSMGKVWEKGGLTVSSNTELVKIGIVLIGWNAFGGKSVHVSCFISN